jgi:hypothetical protein
MRGWKLAALTGFLAAVTVPVLAAPNFVGQSGNIVTPDDRIVQPREFSAGYNFLDQHIFGTNKSKNLIAANYGFTRALEAGLAYETRDKDLLVNAKYGLVPERRTSPSVTLGVVDLFNQLDKNPGGYIVLGKNLTGVSGDVATATAGRALHGYVGLGTGPYNGVMGGLDFIATPQLSLMAEYAPKGPLTGRKSGVNLGARYAISNRVRLQAALFDFDNVGVGISFTSGFGRR